MLEIDRNAGLSCTVTRTFLYVVVRIRKAMERRAGNVRCGLRTIYFQIQLDHLYRRDLREKRRRISRRVVLIEVDKECPSDLGLRINSAVEVRPAEDAYGESDLYLNPPGKTFYVPACHSNINLNFRSIEYRAFR